MKKVLKNQHGFTLVEIICAIALLGILAVPTYNVFVGASTQQNKSRTLQKANNMAQLIMEDVLASDVKTNKTYVKDDFLVDIAFHEMDAGLHDKVNSDGSYKIDYTSQTTMIIEGSTIPEFVDDLEPDKYGLRLEVFDYADRDIYLLSRVGAFLLFGNFDKIDAFYADPSSYNQSSFFKSYAVSTSFSKTPVPLFDKYDKEYIMELFDVSSYDYDRLSACYAGLPGYEVVSFMKTLLTRYMTMYNAVQSNLGSGTSAEHCINYIRNSENMFDTIAELHDDWLNKDYSSEFFTGVTDIYYDQNLKASYLNNLYNVMNDTVFNTGTKTGPILRSKIFWYDGSLALLPPSDNAYGVFTTLPTQQGSYGTDIHFKFYQRSLSFGDWNFEIPLDNSAAANRFNITLVDVKTNQWTTQRNIFNDITYYVTGALDYRSVSFSVFAQPNILTQEYDPETGTYSLYKANVNFFQKLDHGGDNLEIQKYGDFSCLEFNNSAKDNIKKPDDPDSALSTTNVSNSVDISSIDSLAIKTVVVTLYDKDDTAKKKPIITLLSYKNFGTGKFTTSNSASTDTDIIPPLSALPYSSTGAVKFNFEEGNNLTISNSSDTNVFDQTSYQTNGTMVFDAGKEFYFTFDKAFSINDVNNYFPVTYHDGSDQIKELVWVFDGEDTGASFNISLTGEATYDDKKTVFVIYNYSDVNITVNNSGDDWLEYGGIVIVDKDNTVSILD